MSIPLGAAGATHLECTACSRRYASEALHGLSECCRKPLQANYAFDRLRRHFRPGNLHGRSADIWRYAEVLPIRDGAFHRTLGEGFTPLLDAPRLATELGIRQVWVKDEGVNPTGSFKARGLAVAVARAAELGARAVALPSAGNAGAAAAAYAAVFGLRALVVVPKDTSPAIVAQTRAFGAEVQLVDGMITDAGVRVGQLAAMGEWFDLSTLKEPYRVEGKKTMGYELFEQLGGRLPDVVVYPTGGGTGLVGMWKAFAEMELLGWTESRRPRLVVVQAEGCAPIVRSWRSGAESAEEWRDARTAAAGLRVPRAIGDFLVLRALRESDGAAATVSDEAMRQSVDRMARLAGVYASLEGAATLAALPVLLQQGDIGAEDEVVLFNTGSGLTNPC